MPVQNTAVTGVDAFNSLDPVTEKLRPEEQLFNSVFQTQFDSPPVVSRPRTDPLLERPRAPPSRRLPETPRRLETTPVRELPPRPNLPRDSARTRQRQPVLQTVTQRVHPFSTTESATSFPIVTLSQFTAAAVPDPVQPVARPRAPLKRPVPIVASTTQSANVDYGNYDYKYDDYDSSPALVSAIGDYDLNPLTSKVILNVFTIRLETKSIL